MTSRSPVRSQRIAVRTWFACLLLAGVASAAPPDRARAETLLEDAKAAMAAHDYQKACPALAESQRLAPAGETQLTLALCYEGMGRYASAWSEFREALAFAQREGRRDREELAREHAGKMQRMAPRLKIVVAEESSKLSKLAVSLDGTPLQSAAWNTVLLLDPGDHVVEAKAPGYTTWTQTVALRSEGTTEVVDVPALSPKPDSRAATRSPPETKTQRTAASSPRADQAATPQEAQAPSRLLPYALLGGGAALLGIGAYFGIRAVDQAREVCSEPVCPEAQRSAYEDYQTSAMLANVGVGAGLLAIGAGTLLILTEPSEPPSRKASSRALRLEAQTLDRGVFISIRRPL